MIMELFKKEEYRDCTINVYYDNDAESPREWDNVATFVCKYGNYFLGDRQDIEYVIEQLFADHVSPKAIIDYFVKTRHAELVEGEEDDRSDHYYKYQEKWYDDSMHDYYIDADSQTDDEDTISCAMADELSEGEKLQLVCDSDDIVILPIAVYEHSGITMWLGSADDHFDSQWDCSDVGFAYIEKETAMKEGALKEGDDWKKWAYDDMEAEMETYRQYLEGEVFGYEIEDEYGEEGADIDLSGCWGYYGMESIDELIIPEAKSCIDTYLIDKENKRQENIHKVFDNMEKLRGHQFIIGLMAYKVGKNMFGMDIMEGAKISNNVVGTYDEVSLSDMDADTISELAEHVA